MAVGTGAVIVAVPLWQRPAVLAGRWHRGLGPFLETDGRLISRLQIPNQTVVAFTLMATVVPSVFHAFSQFGATASVSLIGVAIENVYTESIPFMAAALLVGLLAPTAGAALVAAFIPIDLIASALQDQELTPLLPAVAGRAVSYWLLWLRQGSQRPAGPYSRDHS